jgi:capsular polysaccharide biosynthesis protein
MKPAYVRATRLVAPATIQLSRLGGSYLPSGVSLSMEDAAASSGGRCVVAREPELIARPPLLGLPAQLSPLEPAVDTAIPRVAVMELPDGRVLGRHHAVVTGTGDLVHEVSLYFGALHPREHPLFLDPFPGEPRRIPGRLGVLASRGDSNYFHFLIDVLPRLGVLEQAPDIAAPDRWYAPGQTSFQRELLDMVGIGPEQRIDSEEAHHVQADCLVVPGVPSICEQNPPWVVDFLRSRLLTRVPASTERRPVYIVRSAGTNNRAVTNEAELIRLLTARGFDIVDPSQMSVAEQIRTFATAPVIVSPHGAALANLVFTSPGSTVIELFPPGCVLLTYWRLASGVPGLDYRYLSDWPTSARQNRPIALVSDMTVDLAALSSMLDEVQT